MRIKVAFLATFGLLSLLLIVAKIFLGFGKEAELNPLNKFPEKRYQEKREYKVLGFLPTWMIGKSREYCDEVSHLIFLGVEVAEDGDLIWDTQSKKIYGDVYVSQKEKIKSCGGKNILGVKLFDDNKLNNLLSNESAINKLTEQIRLTVVTGGFDGVNVDFEFQGSPVAILNEDFNIFLAALKSARVGEISVDVFANTIIKGREEKVKALMNNVDDLVVMAYDFHRPGSDYAGPVAPIDALVGDRNILEVTQRMAESNLDRKKIILAYPLYGYEWKTESSDFGSKVKRGWSAMASYKRMKDLMASTAFVETSAVKWDELSMSPWISFEENGEIHQIYYENLESLKRKIRLAIDNQCSGVGFWALGYEGENLEVWEEVKNSFIARMGG